MAEKEVAKAFGDVEIAQLKSVIREMQRQKDGAEDVMELNNTFIKFLREMHRLKMYELDKA